MRNNKMNDTTKMFNDEPRPLEPQKCVRASNNAFSRHETLEYYCKVVCKYNIKGECYCSV